MKTNRDSYRSRVGTQEESYSNTMYIIENPKHLRTQRPGLN